MSVELGNGSEILDRDSQTLYPQLSQPVVEQPSLYPSLAPLFKIQPLDFQVASSLIKVEEPIDEQAATSNPYSQPVGASYGIPQIFSWLWSSKPESSKPLIQWGKDHYPAKEDFIEASKLYYGPRIIYIPHTTQKAQYQRLVRELEMAHTAYMKVINEVSTVFSQKVNADPLSSRITQYNAAIKECSELFDTIGKQRQVARDLRGFFLNHLIEDEGGELSPDKVDSLVNDHLLPFAKTGDPQHPFAKVTHPSSGVQYVTLGKEKRRPNLFEVPDFQTEKERTEAEIRSKIIIADAPIVLSALPSAATLAATIKETAEKAFDADSTVNLLEWKADLKQLHEEYRAHVHDGESPLKEAYSTLNLYLIQAHWALKLDVDKLEHDSSEENKKNYLTNCSTFDNVKSFFKGIHEAMGDEAPDILHMTKLALEYAPPEARHF